MAPILAKSVEDEPDEKEAESDEDEESSETRSLAASGGPHTAWPGRTVTLQMLLSTGILKPEKSSMAIEYLGQKFMGDLLPDGKIKSVETETVFCSPSAWAINCKRIINPEKKSGCGWSSVKYKGKKLEHYKQIYFRKMQSQKECSPSDDEPDVRDVKESSPPPPIKRHILTHNTINNRHITHDANSLLEAVTFATLGKLQPFHMTVSTSALLLMDLHSHLTKTEVSGYLGGSWDTNTHNLTITHSFPCRNTQWDREKAGDVELAIKKAMAKQNLSLVGWYHSHPRSPAQPTLRDIDAQLEYQIKMRGPSEASYSPCIGMICSPYYQPTEDGAVETGGLESALIAYWVVPPSENKPHEYGRPMLMTYSVQQDKEISSEVMEELRQTLTYYRELDRRVLVKFGETFRNDVSYADKIKTSLFPKFAKNGDALELWNIIREGVGLPLDESFEAPICDQSAILALIKKEEPSAAAVAIKEEGKSESGGVGGSSQIAPTPLSQISSLQEQLNMPSGLNMNPILFSNAQDTKGGGTGDGSQRENSPRELNNSSPITIPSNSASPAKFEVPPVRMSPSPAKSDTASTASSSRARNSPAPSPGMRGNRGQGGDLDLSFRASPNITSIPGLTITPSSGKSKGGSSGGMTLEKMESMMAENLKSTSTVNYEGGSAAAAAQNMNELFSASLASLSKSLPPGLLSSGSAVDYQNLFGMSPSGGGGNNSGSSGGRGGGERERERDRGNKSTDIYSHSGEQCEGRGGRDNRDKSSSSGSQSGQQSASSTSAAAAALAKEKFTIEQLMQSPVVPPHLKELLSQIDQNDLNFILSHPMFNNPEFLNALMPKGGSGERGGGRDSSERRGGGDEGRERDRESQGNRGNNSSSNNSSSRTSGGGGGSSRTSGSGKQSSGNSYGGERQGSGGNNSNSSKEPKGYYDTHQLPSSLANSSAVASSASSAGGGSGGSASNQSKGGKSSSSSAAAQQQQQQQQAAAAAAQNMMMMSQYEEANKQLAELMKSPEYAMLMQQNAAAAAYGMGFDPAAMLASHFTGPVPQPPGGNNQGGGGGSGGGGGQGGGGGGSKKSSNSKGKQAQAAAAAQQQQQQQQQQAAAAAAAMSAMGLPPMPSLAELNSLLQATQKMPELSSLFGAKPSEINALIQQQMAHQMRQETEAAMQQAQQQQQQQQQQSGGSGGRGGGGGRGRGSGNSESKAAAAAAAAQSLQQQQQQQHAEINALFGSKLPDLTTITPISTGGGGGGGGGGSRGGNNDGGSSSSSSARSQANRESENAAAMAQALAAGLPPEFASLFAAQGSMGGGGGGGGKKGDPMPNNDMLATLLQIGKSSDLSQLLFPPGSQPTAKQLADLNAFFSHPPPGLGIGKSGGGGGGGGVSAQEAMSMYPNISVSALQSESGGGGGGGRSGSSSRKQQQQQAAAAAAVQQQQAAQILQFQQEQQELANLYQQHLKYPGIPDPLSKSTLAANNLYMTPSAALMKMQQEALNSIMMKPPKAGSSSAAGGGGGGGGGASSSSSAAAAAQAAAQQSLMASHLMGAAQAAAAAAPPPLSHSPLSERLLSTPTKSNSSASSSRGNSPQVVNNPPVPKSYGFSAADLAISSVGQGRTMTPSPKSTTSSNYGGGGGVADLSRKSMSPANLSAFGGESGSQSATSAAPPPIKKRMEFSSIADLAAPPPAKVPKFDDMGMRMPSVSPALSSTGSLTGRDVGGEEQGSGGGGALNLSGCD